MNLYKTMTSDHDFMLEKLDNFKKFLGEVSENEDVLKEYENLSPMKMILFANVYLIPCRDDLDDIVSKMRERLMFADEHNSKVKRYIKMFIELISGVPYDEAENEAADDEAKDE